MDTTIPQSVSQEQPSGTLPTKYYVYTYAYPDGTVFYVGKGQSDRINAHEREARQGVESYKCNVIRQIWRNGGQVIKTKVQEHMTAPAANQLEIDLIRLYGREHLTNMTDGGDSGGPGRPQVYTVKRKPVTLNLPTRLTTYIDTHCENRTAWIIAAIQEKIDREQGADMVQ